MRFGDNCHESAGVERNLTHTIRGKWGVQMRATAKTNFTKSGTILTKSGFLFTKSRAISQNQVLFSRRVSLWRPGRVSSVVHRPGYVGMPCCCFGAVVNPIHRLYLFMDSKAIPRE